MTLRVLCVVGDPGGAEAVLPAVERLCEQGAWVHVLAARASTWVARRYCLPFSKIDEILRVRQAQQTLRSSRANVLLTSTSSISRAELVFWRAARRLRIPSLGVIDYWNHYRRRFCEGQREVYPDYIAVPDQRAKGEAGAAGIPTSRLCVTGNPHYEHLLNWHATMSVEHRAALRSRAGIRPSDRLVYFLSRALTPESNSVEAASSQEILKLVCENLATAVNQLRTSVCLLVKFHPREAPYVLPQPPRGVAIKICAGQFPVAWALTADLVLGPTGAVLMQCSMLGCNVLGIHVGSAPQCRSLDSIPICNLDQLPAAILPALGNPFTPKLSLLGMVRAAHLGSIERFASLVRSMRDGYGSRPNFQRQGPNSPREESQPSRP